MEQEDIRFIQQNHSKVFAIRLNDFKILLKESRRYTTQVRYLYIDTNNGNVFQIVTYSYYIPPHLEGTYITSLLNNPIRGPEYVKKKFGYEAGMEPIEITLDSDFTQR